MREHWTDAGCLSHGGEYQGEDREKTDRQRATRRSTGTLEQKADRGAVGMKTEMQTLSMDRTYRVIVTPTANSDISLVVMKGSIPVFVCFGFWFFSKQAHNTSLLKILHLKDQSST